MIRRDVLLADGAAGWYLAAQPEHARISGQFAAACQTELLFGDSDMDDPAQQQVRDEVLAAIVHHDDGWTEWEKSPRIDAALLRPLSFTELPAAEAVDIWERSVKVAESIGPLAAWMVGGHFARLLSHADHMGREPVAMKWQADVEDRRVEWLSDWTARNFRVHTIAAARRALEWLWTFDEVSLWFCCHGPPREENTIEPFIAGHGTPLAMELTIGGGPSLSRCAMADPWRFEPAELEIEISGLKVQQAPYSDGASLLAAGTPGMDRWRLRPAVESAEF